MPNKIVDIDGVRYKVPANIHLYQNGGGWRYRNGRRFKCSVYRAWRVVIPGQQRYFTPAFYGSLELALRAATRWVALNYDGPPSRIHADPGVQVRYVEQELRDGTPRTRVTVRVSNPINDENPKSLYVGTLGLSADHESIMNRFNDGLQVRQKLEKTAYQQHDEKLKLRRQTIRSWLRDGFIE